MVSAFTITSALLLSSLLIRTKRSTWSSISNILSTLSSTNLDLTTSPRDRFSSLLTVSLAIFLLLLKHLGLGPVIKSQDVREDGTVPLPDLRITAPIFVSQKELKAYNALIRAAGSVQPPLASGDETALLFLAPLITPLIPSLLILRKSPIKPLGAVNVRNTFIFHRPDLLRRLGNRISSPNQANRQDGDEKGQKKTHMKVKGDGGNGGEGMVVSAQMGGELLGRKMKRGVEFDTLLTVTPTSSSSSSSTDTSDLIFSFRFTTLSLIPLRSAPLHTSSAHTPKPNDSTAEWYTDSLPLSLSANSPLLWARLSKDYNPIHTSTICAKLLGLKGKIAHGNMVLALVSSRACQAYISGEGTCKEQIELGEIWTGDAGASCLTVEFRRPVFVPSRPLVRWGKGRVQVYENVNKRDVGGEVGGADEVKVLVDIRAGRGVVVPPS